MFAFFRRSSNRRLIDRLHGKIVTAARDPRLFTDYGVPDTLDGRFEMVTLHAALVVRHLRRLPAPAPDLAQDLTDCLFRHFDLALREMGVGDTSVPKRMRVLAEAFLGRSLAYEQALDAGNETEIDDTIASPLEAALERNIYAKSGAADEGAPVLEDRGEAVRKDEVERLARYVRRNDAALASMQLENVLRGDIAFASAQAD
ncbi:ubiquinol-cytochrome C chaperone family protein [Beijerinckia indica]|uniref:Ubiquinol-cytochrome c chaperone n=1 Tax=Beijerinckia indica subsp. indica (strain ATCC 9039 / DSM 1715 / NCIMB 8712) TaxID=395963 RepID=B2IEJ7_BEII9|nr:ubiquinol-cytochrome C chaperone family protein [Beijerinckia indica]ACB96939.1 ubiquinol-cytochrome c chaperone [Beijerinckia indica subsp. indica ATCC 9039]